MKSIAALLAYLAVSIGMFQLHSAWGALLGFHVVIVVSLLWVRPNIPIAVLFKSTNIKWIFLSVLLCGSSGLGLYFLWAYFALVNPMLEEYFWRRYMGNPTNGFYIYDLIYAGYHALVLIGKVPMHAIIFALTVLTFAGWLWRQVAREDRGLLAPVLGHMAADFTILVAVFWRI